MKKFLGILVLSVFVLSQSMCLFAQEEAISPETQTAEAEDEGVVLGNVTNLDTSAFNVTIKTYEGEDRTFSVVEGESILWKGIDEIEFSDIKNNDEVEIGFYTDENGKVIASWVDILIEE